MWEYLTTTFLAQFVHGLVIGSALALICVGLTLVFGVMNIVNFAHGEFLMVGAFLAWTILQVLHSFWLALLGSVFGTALFALAVDRLTIRPILGRDHLYGLLVTFGVSLILMELVRLIWGPIPRQILEPISGSISFLGTIYPAYRLFVLAVACPLVFGFWWILHRTRFGTILRATSQDAEETEMLGVNVRKVYSTSFVLGAALAAVGGVILAPITAVYHTIGADIILKAFAVVIIGGMGSFPGAVIAALIIGQVESLSTLWISHTAARILTFAIMAGILVVKPEGLFPVQEARK